MTFNQLAFRIFKVNLRKYLLYFICMSFTIIVFFTYTTLLTNKNFMNSNNVNNMISYNLIAPSIIISIFSILFIIYSQNAFIKYRKSEFGLFMVLGMTYKDIRKIIFMENSIISLISLVISLLMGSIFSRLFYYIIIKIINVKNIFFSLSLESYLYTILFFIIIFTISILIILININNYEIINLLKVSRVADKNKLSKLIFGLIGLIFIGIAIYDMLCNYKLGSINIFIRSILLCFIGIYFIISGALVILTYLSKYNLKNYYKYLFLLTNFKHTYGQTKKILFLIIILVSITTFFCSFAITIIADSEAYAINHNPYHLAFIEIKGKNHIDQNILDNILNNGETPLVSQKSIEYLDKQLFKIFSDKDLNSTFNTAFSVHKGKFINLAQIVEDDGYIHEISEISNISVTIKNYITEFQSQGLIKEMVFNNIPYITNGYIIIVNNEDYLSIKSEIVNNTIDIGYIRVFNFNDWKKTYSISNQLSKELDNYNRNHTKLYFNNITQDIKVFKPISRIEEYLERKQSGAFLLFILTFIGILFFISSGIILHFRLMNDIGNERIKYRKLYKIGITENEISKIIYRELKILFFLPYLLGMLFATFYIYTFLITIIKSNNLTSYTMLICIVYLCFQFIYYLVYKRVYIKMILSYKLE